jgi:hypothetical protein
MMKLEPIELHLVVEEHQNWLYAWDKFTNEFKGQGATVFNLFERLQEDVVEGSTVIFRIAKEDGGRIIHQRSLTEETEGVILDDDKGAGSWEN